MSEILDGHSVEEEQIRPLYVKDNEIYAKDVGNGKDKLYIEDITETKSYTLRRGVTKGEGVLKVLDDDVWKDQVFDEWDLSEVPLDQGEVLMGVQTE